MVMCVGWHTHTPQTCTHHVHTDQSVSLRGSQLLSIAHHTHVRIFMDLPFCNDALKLHIPVRTMASAPITERPNPLTMGLGSSTAAEVVHLLCQTDAQMFAGWGGHPGLSDDIVLQVCEHVHAHIRTFTLDH